jgi:signal transduction histidine kinase/ActR/RegA family two-component response regulator
MSVRDYLSWVLVCTVTSGLAIAGYFSWSAIAVERMQYEVTDYSVTLRELDQIGEQLDVLLISADLSIGAGETYTGQIALDLLRGLQTRFSELAAVAAALFEREDVDRVMELLVTLETQLRVQDAVTGGHDDQAHPVLLREFDATSGELVGLYQKLHADLHLHTEVRKDALSQRRENLPLYHLLALGLYLLVSALIVYWCSRRIAWPLEVLSNSAREATEGSTPFHVPTTKLREIVDLGKQFSGLVSGLEHMVADRTHELQEKTRKLEAEITNRKAVQADLEKARLVAEESSRAKSEFLSVMSHELRTPMNAVLGALTLIRDSGIDGVQASYVRIANESGQALLALLGDILDLSKIESGGVTLNEQSFSVTDLVSSTLDILRGQAEQKGLQIGCVIHDDVPDTCIGDFDRLRQILLNLVGNAIKFTDIGSVNIEVSLEQEALEKNMLRFAVVDTGVGVPQNVRESIFDPFSQLDSSLSREHSGVGLGLSICSHLSAAMGGECGVDSRMGGGSIFWFTAALPVADAGSVEYRVSMRAQSQQPLPANSDDGQSAARAGSGDLCPARVLIVEDSEVNQMIASAIIENAGHHVEVEDSGEGALDRLTREQFDVILMDIQMPGMDGLESTRRIRQLPGPVAETHVIAFSANVLESTVDECISAGIDDFVGKPIDTDTLLSKIAGVVSGEANQAGDLLMPAGWVPRDS